MKMNPVVHFEFPAENRKRISNFYSKVFGWKTEETGEEMGNYILATTTETDENRMVKTPGTINGGFFEKSSDNPMQHPSVVISVDDINEHMKMVRDAGGQVLGEPVEIPGVGKYVVFVDTEGNKLSMMQPKRQ